MIVSVITVLKLRLVWAARACRAANRFIPNVLSGVGPSLWAVGVGSSLRPGFCCLTVLIPSTASTALLDPFLFHTQDWKRGSTPLWLIVAYIERFATGWAAYSSLK